MNYINSKKWITGLFVAGLLFTMPACELLDQAPQDRLTRDEFFLTAADATASVIAVYDALQAAEGRMAELGEARGDLVDAAPGNEYRLQYIQPTSVNARWAQFYLVINRANTTIKYVPEIVSKDARFTQQMSDAIIAEAHFLRALSYFYLVRGWDKVPLVLNPADTDNQEYKIPQASQEEVLNQIEADLNKALELKIPASYSTIEATKGRATEGAVYALQTDIYLWRKKYAQAVQTADKLINNPMYNLVGNVRTVMRPDPNNPSGPQIPITQFSATKEEWMRMFHEGNTTESIFELQHSFVLDELNNPIGSYGALYNINTLGLQEKYINEQDFVRGSLFASYGPIFDLWKFVGASTSANTRRARSDANWIVYRLADIYLMRAEANNRLDKRDLAIADLKRIRDRANLSVASSVTATSTQDEIEDAILYERGLELAFEGKRWFDLLRIARNGRPAVLTNLIVASYPPNERSAAEGRILDSRGWYLPVSQAELAANRALVQNPYYL